MRHIVVNKVIKKRKYFRANDKWEEQAKYQTFEDTKGCHQEPNC